MAKQEREPRERTEVSVAKLVEVADEIERDVVSEVRHESDEIAAVLWGKPSQ